MRDISGFGMQVVVRANRTFPSGVVLTQFADDADPFDTPAIKVADRSMGLNGDMVVWSKATPIDVTVNLIPGSADDRNMGILLEANRVGRGKLSAQDVVTLVGIYPDGTQLTLQTGRITDGMSGTGVASAGRLKSKPYTFTFENRTGGPA